MIVYLYAEFDLCLLVKNETHFIRKGEIYYIENEMLKTFSISPYSINAQLLPYVVSLGPSLTNCANYDVYNVESGKLVVLKPAIYYSPKYIFDCQTTYNSSIVKVEYAQQQYGYVKISYKEKTNTIDFEDEIKSVQLYTKKIFDNELVFLKVNLKESEYYLIYKGDSILFSGFVKDINIDENVFKILYDDKNCYGQKKVIEFDKSFKEKKYFIKYDSRNVSQSLTIDYLFLDAIKLKKYAECVKYLDSELCSITESELFSYFEDFDNYIFLENQFVLIKNLKAIKIIRFKILNNKIINIID